MEAVQPKFTVRAATREDAPFLAWALLQSSRYHHPRGLFEILLGFDMSESALLSLLQDLLLDESERGKAAFAHWDGWFVAQTEDGTLAAGLAGYESTKKFIANFLALLPRALAKRGCNRSPNAPNKRADAVLSCMVTLGGSDEHWMVEFVATKPEFCEQGVTNLLLQTVLTKGRELGYTKAQVSVLSDSHTAIKTFEKAGFVEYNTVTSPAFLEHVKSPGVLNMRMSI